MKFETSSFKWMVWNSSKEAFVLGVGDNTYTTHIEDAEIWEQRKYAKMNCGKDETPVKVRHTITLEVEDARWIIKTMKLLDGDSLLKWWRESRRDWTC